MDIRLLFTETYDHMNYRKAIVRHCDGRKPLFQAVLKHEQAHKMTFQALTIKPQYLRS